MSARIVALGGGHGLYATLSAARRLTPSPTTGDLRGGCAASWM
jgi:2-phospho-L-lactate transferase/gluconeogenesis factor (CofD/UPF0052 family)